MSTINKTIKEKSKEAQLNPRQLGVYIIAQIIPLIQGMIPLLIGEAFNPYWFILSFIMDNVAYFMIMALRGTKYTIKQDEKFTNIVWGFLQDLFGALRSSAGVDQKISDLEKLVVITTRELDILYQDKMNEFTTAIRKNIGEVKINFLDTNNTNTRDQTIDNLVKSLSVINKKIDALGAKK